MLRWFLFFYGLYGLWYVDYPQAMCAFAGSGVIALFKIGRLIDPDDLRIGDHVSDFIKHYRDAKKKHLKGKKEAEQ